MNLGAYFEEFLDGSWFVFLFSSRYDSSLLLSYLGRKNNHEYNSNPNLIHLILNHVPEFTLVVNPFCIYITRSFQSERGMEKKAYQTYDIVKE
jgi:hypothetical protein